jgi:uncharacterized protein YcbX
MAGESLRSVGVEPSGLVGDRAYALRDDEAGEIRSARRWPALMQCVARYSDEPTSAHTPAARIRLPDGTETSTDSAQVSAQLSRYLGHEATLCPLRPASDKQHYRRAHPAAAVAGTLARSSKLRKVVARLANVGPGGDELRRDMGREPGEPMPDFSIYPGGIFEFVSPPGTYFDTYPIHIVTTATLATLRAKYPAGDWDARRFRPNLVIETNEALSGFVELGWSGRTIRVGDLELECTEPCVRCSMVTQPQPELGKDPLILRTVVREAAQNVGIYARVRRPGHVAQGDAVELLD